MGSQLVLQWVKGKREKVVKEKVFYPGGNEVTIEYANPRIGWAYKEYDNDKAKTIRYERLGPHYPDKMFWRDV